MQEPVGPAVLSAASSSEPAFVGAYISSAGAVSASVVAVRALKDEEVILLLLIWTGYADVDHIVAPPQVDC